MAVLFLRLTEEAAAAVDCVWLSETLRKKAPLFSGKCRGLSGRPRPCVAAFWKNHLQK